MLIVFTTVSTEADGERLAKKIVKSKLAACVQVLPRMLSFYSWQGRVNIDAEHLLLIKTLPERFDELSAFITANHPYETPEIAAVDAARVSEPYFAWMREVLAAKVE